MLLSRLGFPFSNSCLVTFGDYATGCFQHCYNSSTYKMILLPSDSDLLQHKLTYSIFLQTLHFLRVMLYYLN